MNKAIFESKRKAMAKDLGYKGNMDSSIEIKQKIEATCRSQMRALKGKLSLESEQVPQQTLDEKERKEIETKWGAELRRLNADVKSVTALMQIILKLYKEKDFKDKVLAIDTAELTLKDIYNDLNRIINLFVCISKNETYSEKSLKILLEWLDRTDNKVQPYHIIKQSILNGINSFNRSKKAHILSVDSTVTIIYVKNNIISSLEDFFDDRRKEKMAYYLPLKNNRFSIHLSDRQTDGNPRSGLSVEETLDLTKLVKDKKLKIFVKNNELKKSNYKFQLISASIGTGIHYYLYEKVGVKWKEKNDSLVEDRTWNEIKSDINEMCETLTYELI